MVVRPALVTIHERLSSPREYGQWFTIVQCANACSAQVAESLQLQALPGVQRDIERHVRRTETHRENAGCDLHHGVLLGGHHHQFGRGGRTVIRTRQYQVIRSQSGQRKNERGSAEVGAFVIGIHPHGLLTVHPDTEVEQGLIATAVIDVGGQGHLFIRSCLHTEGDREARGRNGHRAVRTHLTTDHHVETGRPIELEVQVLHEGEPMLGAVGGLRTRWQQPCAQQQDGEVAHGPMGVWMQQGRCGRCSRCLGGVTQVEAWCCQGRGASVSNGTMNPLFIKMGWSYCDDRIASQGCRVSAEGPAPV